MNEQVVSLHVSVTAHDIAKGIGRSCSSCPVALAITRALRDGKYLPAHCFIVEFVPYVAFVEPRGLEIQEWGSRRCICRVPVEGLPSEACEFAMDFDDWEDFECMSEGERIEWNSDRGNDDDYTPPKPQPFEFDLQIQLDTGG